MKSVLSYEEYLFEKKMNQDLSKGAPAKGKKITKQVDDETSDLPAGKGKSISKTVKPEMADLPKGRGSEPKKMVKTDRKSTRLNSSHIPLSRMPSSA